MRISVISILIVFLMTSLHAQTQVSGVIDSETWTKANNPYQVVGDVNVLQLTVEPGVIIEFTGAYTFKVSGYLEAGGTVNDSIIFRSASGNPNGWNGLSFDNASSQCVLSYARISDVTGNYGLKVSNGSLNLAQLVVKGNADVGISVNNASVQLTHCFIEHNGGHGLDIVNDADVTLIACKVSRNGDNGIHTSGGTVTLNNSIIVRNANEGILLSANGDELDAWNTVFAFNGKEGVIGINAKITIANSILYFNNALHQIANVSGSTTVTYSDVDQPDLGSTNLMLDPLFADTSGVFNLLPHSPAIDAGDPSDEQNDRYFPPSMGELRNDMGAYGGPLARKWYRPLFVAPDTVDFGDVSLGDSLQVALLLKNYGDDALTLNAIHLNGADAQQFRFQPPALPVTIPMADSLHVPLVFRPEAARLSPFSALLSLESDAENREVPLRGRGIVADIFLSSEAVDFAPTRVGSQDSTIIKIYNLGTDTLRLDSVQVTSEAFSYRLSQRKLAPQSDTLITLTIYFAPDTIATFNGILHIFSNDPDESPLAVSLSGTAVAPFLDVSPVQIDFDSVRVGQDSTISILLSNLGNAELTIDSINFLNNTSVFSAEGQPPIHVNAETMNMTLPVVFRADTAGLFRDTLRLVCNDPFRPLRLIPVKATAVAPYISVQPDRLDFGTMVAPNDTTLSLHIRNAGNIPLHVKRLGLTGPDTSSFSWGTEGGDDRVDPGDDSLVVHLRCLPQHSGTLQAQLNIVTDDPRFDSLQIALSARVKAAEMVIKPDTLQFEPTIIFQQARQTLKVFNRGDYDLRIDSVKVIKIDGADFHFPSWQFPQTIRPFQDTLTIPVDFVPQSAGPQRAQLQLFSSDPFVNPRSVVIKAQGVVPLLAASADSVDFGAVSIFRHPKITIVLRNSGTATVVIDSVSVMNDSAQVFRIPDFPDAVRMAPADSLPLPVSFVPGSIGTFAATLRIHWNDPYQKPLEIGLKARADSAFLSVPAALAFGKHAIHSIRLQKLAVKNGSRVVVRIDSIRIVGKDSAQFRLAVSEGQWFVQPSDSLFEIPVEYVPHAIGLHSAVLKLYSSDIREKMLSVNLSGIALPSASAPLLVSTAGDSLNCGSVYVDETQAYVYSIANLGNAMLRLDSLVVSGQQAEDFTVLAGTQPVQIPADSSRNFVLHFTPHAAGERQALLTIVSNDVRSPMTVRLKGEGLVDSTPATVMLTFDTAQVVAGQNLTLSIRAVDQNTTIQQAEVYVKQGGQTNFTPYPLQRTDSLHWQVTIDSNLVSMRGLALYFKVHHGGSITLFPAGGAQEPLALNVRVARVIYPFTMLPERYRMIALPLNTASQTLKDLFGDELGSYDPAKYRFFDWDGAQKRFVELRKMDRTLPVGKAYYLITADSLNLAVDNATSVSCTAPFNLSLAQGWNMIGDPFAFPVAWQNVSGHEHLTLFYFNGLAWEIADTLLPFKGYAVKATNEMVLQVPPLAAGQTLKKIAKKQPDGWCFHLRVQSGNYYDDINFAGVCTGAKEGRDAFDLPEPPVIGKYVALYFSNPEQPAKKWTTDFRDKGKDGYQFDFTVQCNTGLPVQLQVQADSLPEDFDWCLVSPQTGLRYSQWPVRWHIAHQVLRLIVGKKTFVQQKLASFKGKPGEFRLHQNYPNPFNNSTMIQVDLPRADRLSVVIYDITGRMVKRLVTRRLLEAGYYTFHWDGTNAHHYPVASGIYFVRLQGEKFRAIRKIILQK